MFFTNFFANIFFYFLFCCFCMCMCLVVFFYNHYESPTYVYSTPLTMTKMLDNNFATIKSNNKGTFALHICIFICSYYHILCYTRYLHCAHRHTYKPTRYNTHGLTTIALYLMQNGKKHLFLFLITLNKWSLCFSPPEMIAQSGLHSVHVPKTQLHIRYRIGYIYILIVCCVKRLASISMRAVRFCPVVYVLILANSIWMKCKRTAHNKNDNNNYGDDDADNDVDDDDDDEN